MGLLDLSPKVVAAVVLVFLLVLILYFWKTKKTEKSSNKKKKAKKPIKKKIVKGKGSSSKSTTRETEKDKDDDVEESEDEEDSIQDLYNTIHENMVRGMTADEFKKVAGEYGNSMTYLNLKQLYNKAGDASEQAVTVAQYREALGDSE